jgi:succinyl-CoA synthetase alpha subunit
MGRSGTAETKIEALKDAGVKLALKPGEIAKLLKSR